MRSIRVAICTFGKVAVEGMYNGILFFFSAPTLAHIPIQGPQALANTVAPILSNVSKKPSLSMV
jgi:hypothetical protein